MLGRRTQSHEIHRFALRSAGGLQRWRVVLSWRLVTIQRAFAVMDRGCQ
jgi:hypothetical protein